VKSAYFTIYPGKIPPPQNGCRLKSVSFFKAPVSHPPLSQLNWTFTKSTSRHHTKYRLSPDIELGRTDRQLQTNRLSLKNKLLKFKTSQKSPIILFYFEESIKHTSN
jgi:hypothetical protein